MKLALGTVQFGLNYGVANSTGKVCQKQVKLILDMAKISGLDTLDTAIDYGESESLLGRLGIREWKTVTKLPAVPLDCKNIYQWIRDQTKSSISRLDTPSLYGLLLHRPAQLLEDIGIELYDALNSIKSEGLTKKIGISIYSTAELDALMDSYSFDLVQAPLNILDQSLVKTGWAKYLNDSGVELHCRSAFLQGLLLMPSDQRPRKFERWADIWNEWDRWLNESNLTPLQACLYYLNSLSEINKIIVGVDTPSQFEQILNAANGTLVTLPTFRPIKDTRLIDPVRWGEL